jgi:RND family efflux transporter MFP subunit
MKLATIPLVIASMALLTACHNAESEEKPLTPVKTEALQMYSASETVHYSANVHPDTQVTLAFKVGGYVDAIHQVSGPGGTRLLQEGDFVRAGSVLARVRQNDYSARLGQAKAEDAESRAALASGKAQLAEAQAGFERAKRDFTRAENLFNTQSLTRADYDAAKAQLDVSAARVDASRNSIGAMEARIAGAGSVVAQAGIALGDTEIRAPMDGVVLKRQVEIGTLVGAGASAFVLGDMRTVNVVFGVPDTVLSSLRLGAVMPVRAEALPEAEFSGRVTRISPVADPKSRTFDVELSVPNRGNRLKAGMIASVTLQGSPQTKQVLVVPLNAVVRSTRDPKSYAVFVVREQAGKQIARLRDVQLGEAFGNRVACPSGVELGERVVTNGSQLIRDGEAVRVIP